VGRAGSIHLLVDDDDDNGDQPTGAIAESRRRSIILPQLDLEDARVNFGILGRGVPDEEPPDDLYAMRHAYPRICRHARGCNPLPSAAKPPRASIVNAVLSGLGSETSALGVARLRALSRAFQTSRATRIIKGAILGIPRRNSPARRSTGAALKVFSDTRDDCVTHGVRRVAASLNGRNRRPIGIFALYSTTTTIPRQKCVAMRGEAREIPRLDQA